MCMPRHGVKYGVKIWSQDIIFQKKKRSPMAALS